MIHVPDQNVMFTGDIVEYHSACYCGDGHFAEWGETLDAIRWFDVDAIAPGRGDALVGREMVNAAIESTRDFLESTYRPAARVAARGGTLKDAWDAVRAECDPKFSDFAIYEHCLPFNVARAHDEARGIDTPRSGPPRATRRCGRRCRDEPLPAACGSASPSRSWGSARSPRPCCCGAEPRLDRDRRRGPAATLWTI